MSFPDGEWSAVEADASTRLYYRGLYEGKDSLLARFGEDRDGLLRFLHVGRLFSRAGLSVPKVYSEGKEENQLVMEWVASPKLSDLGWSERFEDLLLDAAQRISSITEWGEGPDLLALDEKRLAFELDFFLLHFVERFMNEKPGQGVKEGIGSLASRVAAYPRKLAHRDLHSDNVLLTGESKMVLLDFQDALTAPRCYDAVSLSVDCYRVQNPAIVERFRKKWCSRIGVDELEFDTTALQRSLKALGTFGRQVTGRKAVRYISFIPSTAKRALDLLDIAPPLTGLRPLLEKAVRLLS